MEATAQSATLLTSVLASRAFLEKIARLLLAQKILAKMEAVARLTVDLTIAIALTDFPVETVK